MEVVWGRRGAEKLRETRRAVRRDELADPAAAAGAGAGACAAGAAAVSEHDWMADAVEGRWGSGTGEGGRGAGGRGMVVIRWGGKGQLRLAGGGERSGEGGV